MCSNVETNLSWTCFVSGLLNSEHPSVLLFCFVPRIFVKRNLSPGLPRWSSLQTKEGQRHTEFLLVGFENSQTPSTTVWPSDHVLGPSTALYEPFLKHCTLTNKAVRTIWRSLSKPPQRRQGPDLCPLWLLFGTPLAIISELALSRAEHSRPYSDVAK